MKLFDTRILIVEDDKDTRMLLKHSLRAIGMIAVSSAVDGAEAIRLLKKEKFDLIICDWNMPIVNGLDVLQAVRSLPNKELPFIMLTAENTAERVMAAMAHGVTDYIVKPWTLDILSNKIEGKVRA